MIATASRAIQSGLSTRWPLRAREGPGLLRDRQRKIPDCRVWTSLDRLLDMAFADSLVAPLSIINAMIVALSRKKSDELRERLRELEKIWDEYDVYDKNN